MASTRYDSIGSGYNTTRRADPYITDRVIELLDADVDKRYLDIGCGTGNYLAALASRGLNITGIDPSETMLAQAREKTRDIMLLQSKAEHIPLPDDQFDGAIAMVTIHHWDDMLKGFSEVARVLKPGARFVVFSFTPEQVMGYWLNHYFPDMMARTFYIAPGIKDMERLLHEAGFENVETEKYFVRPDLEDHFLYAGKHDPERYLVPEMRDNTSAFRVFADPEEVMRGLLSLEADIRSGKINEVIRAYENELGDYIFFRAVTQAG